MIQSMTALREEAARRPRRTVAVVGAHDMDVEGILGTRAPILLNSRGDSADTKRNSIALGSLLCAV